MKSDALVHIKRLDVAGLALASRVTTAKRHDVRQLIELAMTSIQVARGPIDVDFSFHLA